jgi:hypothetical protein
MRYAALSMMTLLAAPLRACFFCEEGANNTALFVMGIFGMFMLGMMFICIAYARAGAFKGGNRLELRVLEAEGISTGEEA